MGAYTKVGSLVIAEPPVLPQIFGLRSWACLMQTEVITAAGSGSSPMIWSGGRVWMAHFPDPLKADNRRDRIAFILSFGLIFPAFHLSNEGNRYGLWGGELNRQQVEDHR